MRAEWDGSPLGIAVLGVESLPVSLAFYRDVIGLDASSTSSWQGPAFEAHWRLPAGATAKAVLLGAGQSEVGRILLLEFDAPERRRVRESGEPSLLGLWNLNFYVADIRAKSRDLAARGYVFWSEPVGYDLDPLVGSPTEVIFEGPDGVLINLVQLSGGGEDTVIGRTRRFLEEHGSTRTGYTEVVTTSHCVRSTDEAAAFYREVCGMEVLLDAVLDKPETNRFLRRPPGGRTRATFLMGDSLFGKVALSHPLNYEVEDRVALAVAPNIGYLAQSFSLPDLGAAEQACARTGAVTYSPRMAVELPGIGTRDAMLVRIPGSGALVQLVEASSEK